MKTNASATMTSTTLLESLLPCVSSKTDFSSRLREGVDFQALDNPTHPVFGLDALLAS